MPQRQAVDISKVCLAKSLGSHNANEPHLTLPAAHTNPTLGQASAFKEKAALVGKGIQSTSQKLHQLTQLAKRTSMFDDPAREINELTAVLKQDIQGLNIQIADLQNTYGSAADGNKQSANHTHTVVDSLRLRLKDTTKEFQEALTIRNDNLKSQTDRRNLFSAQPRVRSGRKELAWRNCCLSLLLLGTLHNTMHIFHLQMKQPIFCQFAGLTVGPAPAKSRCV